MGIGVILTSTSAGSYEVRHNGYIIGFVSGRDRRWYAKTADFDLGEHRTRREAVEAMLDVYLT